MHSGDETRTARRCQGTRKSWPWKGYPCGAWGHYILGGKGYCANHYAMEMKKKRSVKQTRCEGGES